MGLTRRVFGCELYGPVEGIDVVSEGDEAVLVPGPDEKYIVDIPQPQPRATWCRRKHALFEVGHEETSIGWGHTRAHSSPMYLEIVFAKEGEIVLC